MTTPPGVHSMGCATRCLTTCKRLSPSGRWVRLSNRSAKRSRAGEMTQTAGHIIKSAKEDRIVAQVDQVARQDRSCASTHVCEHDAHGDEDADVSPAAPELLGVGKAEEDAGRDHARHGAEAARDHGEDAAAKESLFH